jgi:hypothetical protein
VGVIQAPVPDVWVNSFQIYVPVFGGRRTISWQNYTGILVVSNNNQTGTTPTSSLEEFSCNMLLAACNNVQGSNCNLPLTSSIAEVGLSATGNFDVDNLTSITVVVTTCPSYCILRPGDPRMIAVGWITFTDDDGYTTRKYINFDTTNLRVPRTQSGAGVGYYFRPGVVATIQLESVAGYTMAVIGAITLLST